MHLWCSGSIRAFQNHFSSMEKAFTKFRLKGALGRGSNPRGCNSILQPQKTALGITFPGAKFTPKYAKALSNHLMFVFAFFYVFPACLGRPFVSGPLISAVHTLPPPVKGESQGFRAYSFLVFLAVIFFMYFQRSSDDPSNPTLSSPPSAIPSYPVLGFFARALWKS